jgi:hypothetical protein
MAGGVVDQMPTTQSAKPMRFFQSPILLFALISLIVASCDQPTQKLTRPKDSFLVADSMWGKSESDIRTIETLRSFADKYGELSYSGFVKFSPTDSLCTILTYYFQSGKLNKVQHYLKFSSTADSPYVNTVRKVYAILLDAKGKPVDFNTRWHNDLYQHQPLMFARALRLGHVSYDAVWDSRLTKLKYDVFSDVDGELTISLGYVSKEYSNMFTPER